ncbi:GNAT family N-acetyltransferase [Porphyromonas loveana]|uniref:Acetyltransferase (GNAT) family protein n=1 Tax=Porphyromonas loveana TaxID=1884669 RepID=A0A2U1FSM3_9PORP|nr:GNAT family N-acetyltransferase [Porphyromonas loveana]PVZ15169.1 acetyltransferase (GNAT) family protein [Porphyromonas loveana]
MHIRRALPSDYDRILSLWEDARQTMLAAGNPQWQGAYPGVEEAREDIAAGDAYLLEIDGEAMGIMAVNDTVPAEYAPLPWQTTGLAYTIHRLGVHSSLLRQGYAATMLLRAEAIAREQGATCIHIDTYSPNVGAQQLFEQLGYRRVGPFEMKQKPLPYIAFEKAL